jgi:hypothetical protein
MVLALQWFTLVVVMSPSNMTDVWVFKGMGLMGVVLIPPPNAPTAVEEAVLPVWKYPSVAINFILFETQ